ncbi:MAG: Helicase associated domain protein [Burkholderiales bacterium]|nr:Helicase associated domain protein [Burkholderiales bacterium]
MKLIKYIQNTNNWSQIFYNLTNDQLNNNEIGNLFEVFCKYYYQNEPSVKDEYRNVWLFSEIPPEIKQNLNLGQIDHGADLILEDLDNEYTAIQCKFRSDQNKILNWTADRLTNLLAEGEDCKYKLVFTNASGLDAHTLKKNVGLVSLNDLLEIEEQTIVNIVNNLEQRKANLNKAYPHNYQKEIINEVCTKFKDRSRGQLILPCGTGKTLVSLWIKEALNSKVTLVVLPSLALLRQTKHEWSKNQNMWQHYLCVCSEQNIDKDSIVVHEYELGTHVTTNPEDVREFLSNHSEQGCIIYSTYQSLKVIREAIANTDIIFELIISDEAHKTTGSKATIFGLIHDNVKIPAKRRLYMTATPRVLSKNMKTKLGDDLEYFADMSNPEIYGHEFYRMSFKTAIEQNILVDYKLLVIGVNNQDIKNKISTGRLVDTDTTIEDYAHNVALSNTMVKYNATHAITFHTTVKRASDFSRRHKKISKLNNIYIDHVSGKQPTNERAQILTKFKDCYLGVLSNARCLTEGVDVPSIDLVYFSDAKESKVDIVQAVGRALRQSKGKQKTHGYIVVPIFFSPEDGIEKTVAGGAFKNLINIVKALCDQDERLQDEINNIRFNKINSNSIAHLSIDIGIDKINDLIILEGFEEELRKSLFDEIIYKTSSNWDLKFNELCAYLNHNNNQYPENDHQLYSWVSAQRSRKSQGLLSLDRVHKLDTINFIWSMTDSKWWQNYNELKIWVKSNQSDQTLYTKWPSQRSNDEQEENLTLWMNRLKQDYKKNLLPKEQVELLQQINFPFDSLESRWQESYTKLKQHINDFGRFPTKDAIEKTLYEWCKKQASSYSKNTLSIQQLKLLQEINFNVFIESIDPWKNKFNELTNYINMHQKVPTRVNKNSAEENSLGSWISKQKQRNTTNELSQEQVKLLEDLGVSIELVAEENEQKWNKTYKSVIEFRKINSTRWPSSESKTDHHEKKLGRWLNNMNSWYNGNFPNNGPFPLERYEKLVAIGFNFKAAAYLSWDKKFDDLCLYLEKNNGILKSTQDGKNVKEYNWVNNQRKAHKKGNLTEEQLKRLNDVGIDFQSNIIDNRWNNNYQLFRAQYLKYSGQIPSTLNGKPNSIYQWVTRQKKIFKTGKLTQEQVDLLQNSGIDLS